MGSQASPEISDITMYEIEMQILAYDNKIVKWWRYRDDILLFYEGTENDLVELIDKFNKVHPTIKFTYDCSQESVQYLDLTIFKGERFRREGVLDLKSHIKKTETFQYLERTSAHPLSCFRGFITGETLRHNRLCSNKTDFIQRVQQFGQKLLERGYDSAELMPLLTKIDHSHRGTDLNKNKPPLKEPPLVIKLTYSPCTH